MINFPDRKPSNISFGVNLKSPKLKFTRDDFFIRIRGYGKNDEWVKYVKETADEAVENIRKGVPFEEVLHNITTGIKIANQCPLDIAKRLHTGILRIPRKGWDSASDWTGLYLNTPYGNKSFSKYKVYEEKLDEIINHPLQNPFDDLELTRPKQNKDQKFLMHADEKCINNAFKHIEKLYNFIVENYIQKEATAQDLPVINNAIAQIRWIMAHATPWERGSDSISNVFMKSLYKAIGIKTTRPAKNISFDLEAFCNNLETYKKKFPSFFEKTPEIVE